MADPAEKPATKLGDDADKNPASKPKADTKPVHLLLIVPIDGLIAGRVGLASPSLAATLIKDGLATKANAQQIAMAGGRIAQLGR